MTDYTKKLMNYDSSEADTLVGKTVKMNWGECLIKDHVHYHFFIERISDGHIAMEPAYSIIKQVKETAERESMKSENAIEKIFEENGFYIEPYWSSNGKDFAIYGKLEGFGDSGCMIDHSTVMCNNNSIDGYIEIGAGGRGYSYCHTFERDETKKCGYRAMQSRDELDFDTLVWKPIESLYETMKSYFIEEFDKNVPLNLESIFKFKVDRSGNYVFWDAQKTEAYKHKAHRFLIEPKVEESWHKKYWTLQIGDIKDSPSANKSGKAGNGRRASWGDKWTLPKDAEEKTGAEIRELIFSHVLPAIEEIAKRRSNE